MTNSTQSFEKPALSFDLQRYNDDTILNQGNNPRPKTNKEREIALLVAYVALNLEADQINSRIAYRELALEEDSLPR
jgi:hypothetical protein